MLNATVDEVIPLYKENKAIVHMLRILERVGLGYLSLGQSATTLSGGEAQRIKLARELGKALKPNSLYVLDEPTTGLSFPDVEKLMLLLNELTEQGNTVIITEHDAAILSFCDWLVEIGPGGGTEGGTMVAAGTPADLKRNPTSLIGPYLSV
jgi:excinuclease UvrABC ATPase subunit